MEKSNYNDLKNNQEKKEERKMIRYGCKEIIFKKLEEGGCLICDIKWYKPQWVRRLVEIDGKNEIRRFKDKGITENEIVMLDTNNTLLMEKAKLLEKGDIVYLSYTYLNNDDKYSAKNWQEVDILDELHLMEMKEKSAYLFHTELPKRESIIQPKRKKKKKTNSKEKKPTKKDIEIAQLKSQIQLLQKQLEEKANAE